MDNFSIKLSIPLFLQTSCCNVCQTDRRLLAACKLSDNSFLCWETNLTQITLQLIMKFLWCDYSFLNILYECLYLLKKYDLSFFISRISSRMYLMISLDYSHMSKFLFCRFFCLPCIVQWIPIKQLWYLHLN